MISLFQTPTGSWHIPSILMAASWLIGTLVAGGFMLANLRVNRDDRIAAFHAQQQAAKKIAKLEEATKSKSLSERLVDFVNALDPRIIPALATQDIKWSGQLRADQSAQLESFFMEHGAEKYLTREKLEVNAMQLMSDGSMTHGITFAVHRQLLVDSKGQ